MQSTFFERHIQLNMVVRSEQLPFIAIKDLGCLTFLEVPI